MGGVWVSENIRVESSALLPFDIRIGDHHPILININTISFIGEKLVNISRLEGRRPQI